MLGVVGSILCSGVFLHGVLVGHRQWFPFDHLRTLNRVFFGQTTNDDDQYGRWHAARDPARLSETARARLDRLAGLGYLRGYTTATEAEGVVTAVADQMQPGLTMLTSGHAPVAFLVDVAGEPVHTWEVALADLWPEELPFDTLDEHRHFIRRARVFPDGRMLGVFEYIGMFMVDRDSRLLWKRLTQTHHDFAVAADGSIVALERRRLTLAEVESRYPGFSARDSGVFDDQIVVLDPSGSERRRVSLLEAFHRSDYAPMLGQRRQPRDLFHANSVHIVQETNRRLPFEVGEVLVSLRRLNAIVSVDLDESRVSWMLTGKWRSQHQAQLLDNGNVLLLDNRGGNRNTPLQFDQSEVLEVNPLTQEVVWRYAGSDETPFFTRWLGYVERLDNGNTLVTESTQGRVFEITRDGRIVWEYLNPHRAGEQGELIATVMGAHRLAPEDLAFLQP